MTKPQTREDKRFSKEELQKANEADIVAFAQEQGIRLRQISHDSYKGVEHDSLVITPSKNDWYWNSRSVGGHCALSFAEKYVLADSDLSNNKLFVKAANMVLHSNMQTWHVAKKREPFRWNSRQVSKYFDRANNYLVKNVALIQD